MDKNTEYELLQRGLAVEAINHEFTSSFKAVHAAMKRFKSWADLNPKLQGVYRDLEASLGHLNEYLSLLIPLAPSMYRQPVEVSGAYIRGYVESVFKERMKRDNIELRVTDKFQDHRLISYPSLIYPAFIILVDNALTWASKGCTPYHFVWLDADNGEMIVSDNGPGVPAENASRIFERGFTTRSEGRGLGLYLARESLAKADMYLSLDTPAPGKGASFRISPRPK